MERKPSYPIADIFIDRMSSRAYSDEPLTDAQLMPLFEAARWAPSAHNEQPWRFIYAHKGSDLWQQMFSLIGPFNQIWVERVPVLVMVLSKITYTLTDAPAPFHTFDTGAACMNLTLQGARDGLVTHLIGDIDYQKAKAELKIPAAYKLEVFIALGKPGKKELLPEKLQTREQPTQRKPLAEIVFKDEFKELT